MEVDQSQGATTWTMEDQLYQKPSSDLPKESDLERLWKAVDFSRFLQNPEKCLDDLFAKRTDVTSPLPIIEWEKKMLNCLHLKYLERRMETERVENIPCLNDSSLVTVRNGQVVSFRCMVQDYIGPEFTVAQATVSDPITGESRMRSTLLRDVTDLDYEEANGQSLIEKEVMLGISPPGENLWVSREPNADAVGRSVSKKSKVDDKDDAESEVHLPDYGQIAPWLFRNHQNGSKPVACFLKIYKTDDAPKQNEVVEVTGVIYFPEETAKNANGEEFEGDPGLLPGTARFPVIHVFSCLKLCNGNSRIPIVDEKLLPLFNWSGYDLKHCANVLREIFSLSLAGDRYAAVYAMIALISRIIRRDEAGLGHGPIGKVVVNFAGIGDDTSDVPELFEQVLQSLMPRTLSLQLTVDNLNSWMLLPKKNLNSDQLEPGLLQMGDGTVVCINETKLDEGKLGDGGARNAEALKDLVANQRVKYNYTYQHPELFTDCPVVTLSQHPTIFNSDIQIVVKPDTTITSDKIRLKFQSLLQENMTMLQNYLSLLRGITFESPPLVAEGTLMDDLEAFFRARNQPDAFKSKMSAQNFSSFITCCRMWSLLNGELSITREAFTFMKEVEQIRDSRLVVREK